MCGSRNDVQLLGDACRLLEQAQTIAVRSLNNESVYPRSINEVKPRAALSESTTSSNKGKDGHIE